LWAWVVGEKWHKKRGKKYFYNVNKVVVIMSNFVKNIKIMKDVPVLSNSKTEVRQSDFKVLYEALVHEVDESIRLSDDIYRLSNILKPMDRAESEMTMDDRPGIVNMLLSQVDRLRESNESGRRNYFHLEGIIEG